MRPNPYRRRAMPYRGPTAPAATPAPAPEAARIPTLTLHVPEQPAVLEYSSDPKKRIYPKTVPVMRY